MEESGAPEGQGEEAKAVEESKAEAEGEQAAEGEDEQQGEFQVMDCVGGDSEAPEADQKVEEGRLPRLDQIPHLS